MAETSGSSDKCDQIKKQMKNAIEVQRVHHMEGGVDTEPFLSLDYRKETSLRFIFALWRFSREGGGGSHRRGEITAIWR